MQVSVVIPLLVLSLTGLLPISGSREGRHRERERQGSQGSQGAGVASAGGRHSGAWGAAVKVSSDATAQDTTHHTKAASSALGVRQGTGGRHGGGGGHHINTGREGNQLMDKRKTRPTRQSPQGRDGTHKKETLRENSRISRKLRENLPNLRQLPSTSFQCEEENSKSEEEKLFCKGYTRCLERRKQEKNREAVCRTAAHLKVIQKTVMSVSI